jgi:hypothetical protein
MKPRLTRRLALAALSLALGAALWLELQHGAEVTNGALVVAPARSPPPTPSAQADPAFALLPLEAYQDIEARPLFWASRRPIAAAGGAAAAPSGLALLGVVEGKGETVALIRHGQPPRVERVHEGATLEGWTVTKVALGGVVLVSGGTEAELKPKAAPPTVPAPAAGAKLAAAPAPQSPRTRPGD